MKKCGLQHEFTVGITIYVKADGDFGFFENGLRQNVIFLYEMFAGMPGCKAVYLLNHGDGDAKALPAELGLPEIPIVRVQDVADLLDIVLLVGAAVDREMLLKLRENGTHIVSYKGGNGAVISMEAMVAKPPRADAERYFDIDLVDVIWMTPQHFPTYAGWCRTLYRCPVEEVPQVWSPRFVDMRVKANADLSFGYKPGSAKWRVGILDPNNTVMKTSHVPMLVADGAYCSSPDEFAAIYVTNSIQYKTDPHFSSFAGRLASTQAGVLTAEERYCSVDFLANHSDCVVTHNWENALNYLYYEVLYGGYPLIHNSHLLGDAGYRYTDFDIENGCDVLLHAKAVHDASLDTYRQNANALLARVSPTGQDAHRAHRELIERLAGAASAGSA